MASIYEMSHSPEIAAVLEELRTKIGQVAGVTITGNRCTVRWNMNGQLVDVHMIIESITTPEESKRETERFERMRAFMAKHPKIVGELHYAETGEWSR